MKARNLIGRSCARQRIGAGGPAAHDRLSMLLAFVVLSSALVLLRAVQLEWTGGEDFRTLATRPITRTRPLPADRGRILARDGTVLAADAHTSALALDYRWLQTPPDPDWLRRQALSPLDRRQRRDAALVRERENEITLRRADLHRRLAQLCGLADDDWQARCAAVQSQVTALADGVNERRLARHEAELRRTQDEPSAGAGQTAWWHTIGTALAELFAPEAPAPPRAWWWPKSKSGIRWSKTCRPRPWPKFELTPTIIRACGSLSWPGGNIRSAHWRRTSSGTWGPPRASARRACRSRRRRPDNWVSSGSSSRCSAARRDSNWSDSIIVASRSGSTSSGHRAGGDVRLTVDVVLQSSAEGLLDAACRPRTAGTGSAEVASAIGGAIVVLDVDSGELLAAASAPRFDPQAFARGDAEALGRLLRSPRHPLVDRVTRMAIPPGSVFKTLSAIALVESQACDPDAPFECQGFLHEPDRQRCQIFRQQGIGHGSVTLSAALAESCNVYFFHHASELGPEPLVAWATRFGFGKPTGIDLPDEAPGNLPQSSSDDPRTQRLALAQSLAIGQGTLTATPLQVARLMAAVANGGRLVRPRIVKPAEAAADAPDDSIAGRPIRIAPRTLEAVREGLRRTVADPRGTAYDSARLARVAIAGKTGTAQTAAADHAWFAGYAPADEPRVAIVVVLEHGGPASGAARIARDLVIRLQRLGYLDRGDPGLAGP